MEYRCFGPPGTGKTTWLTRQVKRASMQFGSENILATSFTKASAVELAGRNVTVEKSQIGTLHSICYHAMGSPPIAEKQGVDDWNKTCDNVHRISKTKNSVDEMEGQAQKEDGDELFAQYQYLRGKQVDRETWPPGVQRFAKQWEKWKTDTGFADFVDMLEFGLNMDYAPGKPRVLFCDEAQDMNPLMLNIIRKWGGHESVDYFINVGDDDQCLYNFLGATPEAFLNPPIPGDREKILPQSYRVPKAVQKFAERIISKVSHRKTKEYLPREDEGEVLTAGGSWNLKNPGQLIRSVEKYLEDGKSVMFLASCSYMLKDLEKYMRQNGITFHNPFRLRNKAWNPLSPSAGVASKDRLLAFLRNESEVWGDMKRPWTAEDVEKWVHCLKAKESGLKNKIKTWIKEIPPTRLMGVNSIFEPDIDEIVENIVFGEVEDKLQWFRSHLTQTAKRGMEYPLNVAVEQGADKLREEPQIMIGTIHSVKGGEADVVFLFPDLSASGHAQLTNKVSPELKDSIFRQFYVGATRARETLLLGKPSPRSPYFAFPEVGQDD